MVEAERCRQVTDTALLDLIGKRYSERCAQKEEGKAIQSGNEDRLWMERNTEGVRYDGERERDREGEREREREREGEGERGNEAIDREMMRELLQPGDHVLPSYLW